MDQDGKSLLTAFDGKTGESIWQSPREAFRACYSAPIFLEKKDYKPEMIVQSTTSVRSYDPDTGAPNWNWVWPSMPLRTVASPVVWNDLILVCSGDGGGDRYMAAVKVKVEAFKGGPPLPWANIAWEDRKKEFPYVTTPLIHQDHVYFVNDRGLAGCYEAKTGQRKWYERLPDKDFTASPVMIDGKMYAISETGEVYVIAAKPTMFQILAKNSMGEMVRASPAVADNRLFIRGQNHLFCIGKKK
jgi:outer membrane protein assembly factor BamB